MQFNVAVNGDSIYAYFVNGPIYFKWSCVRRGKTKIPIKSTADKTVEVILPQKNAV